MAHNHGDHYNFRKQILPDFLLVELLKKENAYLEIIYLHISSNTRKRRISRNYLVLIEDLYSYQSRTNIK